METTKQRFVIPSLSLCERSLAERFGLKAAFKIAVNIMSDKSCRKSALVTHCVGGSGNVKIFRKDEFDASNGNVMASISVVRGNGHGFDPAFMLDSSSVYFMQHDC